MDLRSKLVFMHKYVMNNQEHVKKKLKTFKHIQRNLNDYYHALILNSHHGNINKQLGNEIIPSCKIHMVEEKTLGRGPKDGGKEELGEKE